MNLIVNQVMQFHNVHDAYGDLAVKTLAGPAVTEGNLARCRQTGFLKQIKDLFFRGTVENRRRDMNAFTILFGKLVDFRLFGTVDQFISLARAEILFQAPPQAITVAGVGAQHFVDLLPETARRPTEVSFENLTDVHARRNAERIQDDVNRRPILQIGHVLFGENSGNDALIAVPAGHFVADLKLAHDGDKDFDHLNDARRKLIAAFEFFDLVLEIALDQIDLTGRAFDDSSELIFH